MTVACIDLMVVCSERMDSDWFKMEHIEFTALENGTDSSDSPAIDHLPVPVKVCI